MLSLMKQNDKCCQQLSSAKTGKREQRETGREVCEEALAQAAFRVFRCLTLILEGL